MFLAHSIYRSAKKEYCLIAKLEGKTNSEINGFWKSRTKSKNKMIAWFLNPPTYIGGNRKTDWVVPPAKFGNI